MVKKNSYLSPRRAGMSIEVPKFKEKIDAEKILISEETVYKLEDSSSRNWFKYPGTIITYDYDRDDIVTVGDLFDSLERKKEHEMYAFHSKDNQNWFQNISSSLCHEACEKFGICELELYPNLNKELPKNAKIYWKSSDEEVLMKIVVAGEDDRIFIAKTLKECFEIADVSIIRSA